MGRIIPITLFFIIMIMQITNAYIIEYRQLGEYWKQPIAVSLEIKCEESTIIVKSYEKNLVPASNANVFLGYYGQTFMTFYNGKSDENGTNIIKLPGNLSYMTSLFLLRVEKNGYQTMEVNFDAGECYGKPAPKIIEVDNTISANNQTQNKNNTNQSNMTNTSKKDNDVSKFPDMLNQEQANCPISLGLIILLSIMSFIAVKK